MLAHNITQRVLSRACPIGEGAVLGNTQVRSKLFQPVGLLLVCSCRGEGNRRLGLGRSQPAIVNDFALDGNVPLPLNCVRTMLAPGANEAVALSVATSTMEHDLR